MKMRLAMLLGLLALAGCVSSSSPPPQDERLTVGTVQREIRIGMTGSQVAEVLGSPNIVTTDEQRREVWIYDKLSTEASYSSSNGVASILILGGSRSKAASSTSQQTLTIIIKFDENKKVRDFAYHASRF